MKRSIKITIGSIIGIVVIAGIALAANGDLLQGRLSRNSRVLPAYDETKVERPTRSQELLPAYDEDKYKEYKEQFVDGILLVTSKECDDENITYCCGDGTWGHGLESYATCPEDVGAFF